MAAVGYKRRRSRRCMTRIHQSARTQSETEIVDRWFHSQASQQEDRQKFDMSLSKEGLVALADAPSPMRDQEPWRYTDLQALLYRAPVPNVRSAVQDEASLCAAVAPLLEEHEDTLRLVFVDGVFIPGLSREAHGSAQMFVGGGHAMQTCSKAMRERISSLLEEIPEVHLFKSNLRDSMGCAKLAALNQALFQDCACVCSTSSSAYVDDSPSEAEVLDFIEVVFVTTGWSASCSSPRLLIDVGKHKKLRVVESHVSLSSLDTSLSNGLTRVVLAEGAALEHFLIQQRAEGSRHVESMTAEVAANAEYKLRLLQAGGQSSRVNLAVDLAGEKGASQVAAAMVAGSGQQLDLHSLIHHAVPSCESRQQHKNIVSGNGECIFKGSIKVDKVAQQTDSSQICRSLLLSKKARVKAMPSLQIQADDVACSHGAAVTELDNNQVFYMASRGLSFGEARRLLLMGFPQDVLGELSSVAPKAYERLVDKLIMAAEEAESEESR